MEEKTVGGTQDFRELWAHGFALLYLLFFLSLLEPKAEAESSVLFNKKVKLPDSILRCLAQVRELFLEI